MRLIEVKDNGNEPLLVGNIRVGNFTGVAVVREACIEIYMLATSRKVNRKLKDAKECKLAKDFSSKQRAIEFVGNMQNIYTRLSQLTQKGFYHF